MADAEPTAGVAGRSAKSRTLLHIWRFLANPAKVAAVVPASDTLSRMTAELVKRRSGEFVVELGAGTGVVTRAVLAAGVPADKLIAVELDHALAKFLRASLPGVMVIEDDAFDIRRALPEHVPGHVGTVICGIPLVLLPTERQRQLVQAAMDLMPPDGRLLLYSYWLTSPLPAAELGLKCVKRALTLLNVPPASVWVYERADKNLSHGDR